MAKDIQHLTRVYSAKLEFYTVSMLALDSKSNSRC